MTQPAASTIQAIARQALSDHHQVVFLGMHNVDDTPGRKNLMLTTTLRELLREAADAGFGFDALQSGRPRLVLTFDDGRRLSDELVALLDEFSVRAIFFVCTAESIRSYPACGPNGSGLSRTNIDYLCERHLVGSHSVDHQDLSQLSGDDLEQYLDLSFEAFARTFGFQPWLFSYPWGRYSRSVVASLQRRGVSHGFAACSGAYARWMSPFLIPRVFVDFLPQEEVSLDRVLAERGLPSATAKLALRNLGLVGLSHDGRHRDLRLRRRSANASNTKRG